MPDWRQYPTAPSLCQEQGAFLKPEDETTLVNLKKPGIKSIIFTHFFLLFLFPIHISTTEMNFSVLGVSGSSECMSLVPHWWDSPSL